MPDKQPSKTDLLAQKASIDATLAEMAQPIAQQAKDFCDGIDLETLRALSAEASGICDDVANQIQHVITCVTGLAITAGARLAPPAPIIPMAMVEAPPTE